MNPDCPGPSFCKANTAGIGKSSEKQGRVKPLTFFCFFLKTIIGQVQTPRLALLRKISIVDGYGRVKPGVVLFELKRLEGC